MLSRQRGTIRESPSHITPLSTLLDKVVCELGINEKIIWGSNNALSTKNSKLLNLPSGKRLQSLIQVGFNDELEKEIVNINSILNKDKICGLKIFYIRRRNI